MANKEMTRAQALVFAIEVIEEHEGIECEALNVLRKMHAQVTKPRPRKANTARRDANIALGEKFAEAWDEETFKAANVAEILEVSKPKANAICKAMGWEEIPTTEKVKVYKL